MNKKELRNIIRKQLIYCCLESAKKKLSQIKITAEVSLDIIMKKVNKLLKERTKK